ncbi:hypothetical protein [Streptomyces paromomycinus]|uniref:Uncharacterized protein n=1 Tax=Streptomyces paromomycinus TaxID=92743 RepID=A0A401WFY6_STREY|nr:hypothetical protein [Streptomyces paromomycinus]GCD48233.1 hypothetical protein GKJPGBOP_08029 [Streptomyces paromomycinus]
MTTKFSRVAAAASAVLASGLLVLGAGSAPAGAAGLPGITFYTGPNGTGSAIAANLDKVGECQELPTPVQSFLAISERDVEVYYNAGCRPGAPGKDGDLLYVTGTLGSGNFSYAGLSYRVRG